MSSRIRAVLAALRVRRRGAAPAPLPPTAAYENPNLPVSRARRRPAVAHDAGGEGRADDPGRARSRSIDDPTPITTLEARAASCPAAARRRRRTRPRRGPTWSTASSRRRSDTRLGIPLLYGVDSVHGHGNLLRRHGLPAQHRPRRHPRPDARAARSSTITAEETRATGPQWTFAPCICAARDDRWGRTYESFSEDPDLVTRMETAIDGFQGQRGDLGDRDRVLATAKHYAGDGDTEYGTASRRLHDRPGHRDHAAARTSGDGSLRQYVPAVQDAPTSAP